MNHSEALDRILHDLAEGRIDADSAAALIRQAQAEGQQGFPEAPDDPVPARALNADDDSEQGSERLTETAEGSDHGAEQRAEQANGDADDSSHAEGHQSSDHGSTGPFDFQIDDVASAAGAALREAWHLIGEAATTVLPGEPGWKPFEKGKPSARPMPGKSTETLIVRSVGRRVRIIGDQSVAAVAVDGPHTLRRHGDTVEVTTEGEVGLNAGGFSLINPPRSVEDLKALGLGQELVIRVNPAVIIDAEVTGNKLTTIGAPYLGKIRVSVGQASFSDVVEVCDVLIQAGGASLSGPISRGRSRITVESGNLSLRLTEGADVTIRPHNQLGRISWPNNAQETIDEYVVGDGSAQLELSVLMARAAISVEG